MFLPSIFLFVYFFNGFMPSTQVAARMGHLGNLVLGHEVTQALAGGCRANNVRQ